MLEHIFVRPDGKMSSPLEFWEGKLSLSLVAELRNIGCWIWQHVTLRITLGLPAKITNVLRRAILALVDQRKDYLLIKVGVLVFERGPSHWRVSVSFRRRDNRVGSLCMRAIGQRRLEGNKSGLEFVGATGTPLWFCWGALFT